MKRFISNFCLLVGASVASYAGAINGTSGTNLLGPSAVLINFDAPASFPAGSFTSMPSVASSTGASTNVSITTGSGSGSANTGGSAARTNDAAAGFANTTFFGGPLSGGYLSTYTGAGNSSNNSAQFVRTLTFTFAGGASEFLIDYWAAEATSHTFAVNGVVQSAGLQVICTSTTLSACAGSGRQIGFVADGTTPVINTITFTFVGTDPLGAGDNVIFDNLRMVAAVGTSGTSGSSASSGGGVIPEPSTYALMGAGLMALAYARRKK